MANPPAVQKKRGLGCFGCGCLVLLVIALLFGGLIAGLGYFIKGEGMALTSATAAPVPGFDGGNDLYRATQQKLAAFDQSLQQNQPATLELTANEINTLIARDPDFSVNQIHLFVTLTGDEAHAQASIPTSFLPFGLFHGRYLNFTAGFVPGFNTSGKTVDILLRDFRVGGQDVPKEQLPGIQSFLDPFLNAQMKISPELKELFDHAKSIEVRDGKLEIEI